MQYRIADRRDTTFTDLIESDFEPVSVQVIPIPTNVRLSETQIYQLPELSWENRSINFFLDQFVVAPGTGENIGWFEFLPELSSHADEFSPLGFALRGVSCLSFANRNNYPELRLAALRLNGQALNATNRALQSPTTAIRDVTFAAILVICLFGVSPH